MGAITEARRIIRWCVRHGLIRRIVLQDMRKGDPIARLMLDPAVTADPFGHYTRLREQGMLVHSGFALHTAHHDVANAILRSPDVGVIGAPGGLAPAAIKAMARLGGRGPIGPLETPSMLVTNPPDHTRYRKLVAKAFTTRAVLALRDRVEEVAAELLDDLAARGSQADVLNDYAALLPATIIAEMLGAPLSMRRQLLEWGEAAGRSLDGGLTFREFSRSERSTAALSGWMAGHLRHLRANPDDTILSRLIRAESDGATLTEDELTSVAVLLLGAGFETTVNLIGNGVAQLLAHPGQLALLREEPQRWGNAVEEILRYDSPVQQTARVTRRETEIAGRHLRAGQALIVVIGGANRDPAVFAEPDRFDITRENAAAHLAFSGGVHYCLGAALARMEGEVGLRALFDRFPGLSPAGGLQRRSTRVLRGYSHMPVHLTATARR